MDIKNIKYLNTPNFENKTEECLLHLKTNINKSKYSSDKNSKSLSMKHSNNNLINPNSKLIEQNKLNTFKISKEIKISKLKEEINNIKKKIQELNSKNKFSSNTYNAESSTNKIPKKGKNKSISNQRIFNYNKDLKHNILIQKTFNNCCSINSNKNINSKYNFIENYVNKNIPSKYKTRNKNIRTNYFFSNSNNIIWNKCKTIDNKCIKNKYSVLKIPNQFNNGGGIKENNEFDNISIKLFNVVNKYFAYYEANKKFKEVE